MRKLINLGCKLNQYEGYCLLEALACLPELVIVNTCCVTKEAETKSLKKFRQALRQFPDTPVIASGCACRFHPEKYARAHRIIDNVARNAIIDGVKPKSDKARYFLKIQDGCNMQCSYCIVAKVRNKIQSKTLPRIKEEISWARSLGYKEIVLVGANIGLYGQDTGSSLESMLDSISRFPDLPRLRLSSIEPLFISEDLIRVLRSLPFCNHFHIPIQSADHSILLKMRRGYDRSYLSDTLDLIHANFTDVAIGADIIVGFPGERESEFLNTYEFVAEKPFTHLHVFPYSPRPLTEAFSMGDPVKAQDKKDRLWKLKKLIGQKNLEFRKSALNKTFSVIVENHGHVCTGLTGNYIRVEIDEPHESNALIDIVINEVGPVHTRASVVGKEAISV